MKDTPSLCVIVPLPDSATHLSDLLWSLLRQPALSFEVVVAVDKNRDPAAAAILRATAGIDSRVRVIEVDAARGLRMAVSAASKATSAIYATIADADGLCLDGGYQALVASLETSGSDLAVGAAEVFGRGRGRLARAVGGALDADVQGVNLAESPGLIADDLLCTKVFRLELLRIVVAGVDTWNARAIVARAFVSAPRIDVLSRAVFWHRRRDPSGDVSILSRTGVQGLASVQDTIAASPEQVRECYVRTLLLREVLDNGTLDALAAGAKSAELCDLVRDAAGDLTETSLSEVSIAKRWQLALIAMGQTEFVDIVRGRRRWRDSDVVPSFDAARLVGDAWISLGLGNRDVRTAFVERFLYPPMAMPGGECAADDGIDLSVIIPAFNVASYIDELLHSIRSAVGVRLEIIVVDDSSTDGTWERLLAHQEADPRVRALRSEGRGGGQARNLGIEVARGEYLAFADGDDLVPPHAYAHMLEIARRSGADVVSGSYLKFFSTSTWNASDGYNGAYSFPLEGVTIEHQPQLARHRAVWNRVIRRGYWLDTAFPFPGVPRANDIVAMMSVLLSAPSVAVTSRPVYIYRDRPGSGSMTSAAGSVDYTVSYFSEEASCAALVWQRASTPVTHEYWSMVLAVDAWGNIRKYLDRRAGDAYEDRRVAEQIALLFSLAPRESVEHLSAERQAVWALASAARFDEAQTILAVERAAASVTLPALVAAIGAAADLRSLSRHAVSWLAWKYLLRRFIDDRSWRREDALAHAMQLLRQLLTDPVGPMPVVPTALEARFARAIVDSDAAESLLALSSSPSHPPAVLHAGIRRATLRGICAEHALTYVRVMARRPDDTAGERLPVGQVAVEEGHWSAVIDPVAFSGLGAWMLEVEYEDQWGLRRSSLSLSPVNGGGFQRFLRIAVEGAGTGASRVQLRSPLDVRIRRKARSLFRA